MDLFIYASFLGHSKHIEDKPFTRSTRKKISITHYIIYKISHCSGLFLCFTGLPSAVLLLYWARLPPMVLGLTVLSKRVETGPTKTQIGLA